MATGTDNVIQFVDVEHRYARSRAPSVVGISLSVARGEIVALVGRSGCGKSTLLHLASGFLRPTKGAVLVNGARVRGPGPDRVLMFQQPSLYPWMTVAQNADLSRRFRGRAGPDARVARILDMLHLGDLADRNVQDLSGGQQQRVALARSLLAEPELLLLDEPFSALDPLTRTALQDEVGRVARRLGLTVLLVTHDLDEAARFADRAVVMAANPGRVVDSLDLHARSTETARADLFTKLEAAAGFAAGAGI